MTPPSPWGPLGVPVPTAEAAHVQFFWHTGHHPTATLRGLLMYQLLASVDDDFDADDPDALEFDVTIDADQVPSSDIPEGYDRQFRVVSSAGYRLGHQAIAPGSAVRVVNPCIAPVVELLGAMRRAGMALVVDVTFPMGHVHEMVSFETDPVLKEYEDEAVRDVWRPGKPAHRRLVEAIRLADVVTTSNEFFAVDVLEHVQDAARVHILPDFPELDGTESDHAVVEDQVERYRKIMIHAMTNRWPDHPVSIDTREWGVGRWGR